MENYLFEAVSLTKNADIDQYKHFVYGIGFNRGGQFSFGNGLGKNCIILYDQTLYFGQYFLTIYLKHFAFIESFDLNSTISDKNYGKNYY